MRFFGTRRACTPAEVAALIGGGLPEVRRRIDAGDLELVGGRIPWTDAALAFHASWPPHVLETLVRDVSGYPKLLRPTPVVWLLPRYVLLALERQAAQLARTVEEYAAEELHVAITPETVETFRGDAAFGEAFHFPGM